MRTNILNTNYAMIKTKEIEHLYKVSQTDSSLLGSACREIEILYQVIKEQTENHEFQNKEIAVFKNSAIYTSLLLLSRMRDSQIIDEDHYITLHKIMQAKTIAILEKNDLMAEALTICFRNRKTKRVEGYVDEIMRISSYPREVLEYITENQSLQKYKIDSTYPHIDLQNIPTDDYCTLLYENETVKEGQIPRCMHKIYHMH